MYVMSAAAMHRDVELSEAHPMSFTTARRECVEVPTRSPATSTVRRLLVTVVLALLVATPARSAAAACWRPPVDGVVVDGFRAPACPWCPGNRGLEYRVGRGAKVEAVETGVVTFSGVVAGTRYVVVEDAAGRRVTYGRLLSSTIGRGDRVLRGSTVGQATGVFYLGVRVGGRYVDPAPLLGELVSRRRLIPLDGRRPRPAPPSTVRCARPDADPSASPNTLDRTHFRLR